MLAKCGQLTWGFSRVRAVPSAKNEQEFMEWLTSYVGPTTAELGIGDDAAALRFGDQLCVMSCDVLVSGVHFDESFCSPSDIGWKSIAVNLSDLAAMGASPKWAIVGLVASEGGPVELQQGIVDAATHFGVEVIGGDVFEWISAENIRAWCGDVDARSIV